jgi:uncharacterized membrane protein YfbV (UPF0208 family)
MNLETHRSSEDQGTVTRLEITLSIAFVGLMTTIAVFMFLTPSASLAEQSREAATVALLGLGSAVGGIWVRGWRVPSARHA